MAATAVPTTACLSISTTAAMVITSSAHWSAFSHKPWLSALQGVVLCLCEPLQERESTINQLIMPPKFSSATQFASVCVSSTVRERLICIYSQWMWAAGNQSATQVKTDSFVNADDTKTHISLFCCSTFEQCSIFTCECILLEWKRFNRTSYRSTVGYANHHCNHRHWSLMVVQSLSIVL